MSLTEIFLKDRPLPRVTRRYLWTIPIIVTLGLLGTALEGIGIGLIIPLLKVLDEGDGRGPQSGLAGILEQVGEGIDDLPRLFLLSGLMIVLIVCKELLIYSCRVFISWVYGKVGHDIRQDLSKQLFIVGYPFFIQEKPGRLMNILLNESWNVTEAVQRALEMLIYISAVFIFLVFLLLLSWQMTLAVATGLLLIQAIQSLLGRRLGALSDYLSAENGILASRMLDAVQGSRLIRLFNQEKREHARFAEASEKVRAATFGLECRRWRIQPAVEVLHIVMFLTILIGAYATGVAVPLIATFIVILYRMQPHVRLLQAGLAELRSRSGSMREVDWLLDPASKPAPPSGEIPFREFERALVFEEVGYSYPGATRGTALQNVSFTINKGRSTAIVGRSGSGKSTIVSLICRFLEPSSGRILVDGKPLPDIDPGAWRGRLALASQDLELVEGSIFENIAYGAPNIDVASVEQAARIADAHGFVSALPNGYATQVGHRGHSLSAGQRQRIALARALARDPDILILDEATNAVDGLSEASILEALKARSGSRTTILISHRRSTLIGCDDAVLVQEGRVIAFGPTDELNLFEREDLYD
jgi:ATP-binding cassette, subfamily B, bacterial MsbA